jgi:hypothetical protein
MQLRTADASVEGFQDPFLILSQKIAEFVASANFLLHKAWTRPDFDEDFVLTAFR